MPRRITVLAAVLALAFAGCSSPPKPLELEIPLGFGETWEHFADIADRSGFRLDPSGTDRGLRVFVSRWRESPAPFGKGVRTRLHGAFEKVDERANPSRREAWRLEFWVERQTVTDISRGFEPRESDWVDQGQDREREQILMGQLRLRYGQELAIEPVRRTR